MKTQPRGRTLEKYNAELAKVIGGKNERDHGPNSSDLLKLLLNHTDPTAQIQKLNGYLEYLGLPKFEIPEKRDTAIQPLQTLLHGSRFPTLLAILAALTDDSLKMVLI